jgi:hypothetical protein
MRGQTPVTLGVGHGTIAGEIIFLNIFQIGQETPMVFTPIFLVHVVCDNGKGVQGIHSHTALEAASGFATQEPAHFTLFHQIIDTLVNVCEAVDFIPRNVRGGGHDICVLGVLRHLVSFGNRLHGWPDDGIINHIFQLFAKHIDYQIQAPKTFFVLLSGHHGHAVSPLLL